MTEMETLPTQQIQELLRNNVIFRSFTAEIENGDGELNEAIKIINISKINAGNTVFKQGDPGDSIVLLLKGEVAVYVMGDNGDEIPIARVKENNFVGEMAIIDETDRMASVRAISDCLVGTIFSDDFWKYFDRYQVLAKNVLKGINQRLRDTNGSYIQRLTREKEELERQVKEKTEDLRHKGRVKITTSYNEKKDHVITRINDNGKGMSAEIMRQAMNPFFTTKPVGSGTGVGLSLTKRIIKRHGGDLNIYSKEGEGTTVTMTLPVADIANLKPS